MALMYPIANGNWSTAANWNSDDGGRVGTKPQAGDTVCANGKTITIDEDTAAIALLTTAATGAAAAGGGFTVSTGGNDITATTIQAGTTVCLTITHSTGTVNVTAVNIYGGTAANARGIYIEDNGIVNITGDGTGGSASGASAINSWSENTVTMTGQYTGGSSSGAYGCLLYGYTATHNIIGNQYSKAGSVGHCIGGYTADTCTVNITGDIFSDNTVGGGSGNVIFVHGTGVTYNIEGNLYFGSNSSANHLIYIGYLSTIFNITGNVTGGAIAGKNCIYSNVISTVNITGNITGGSALTSYGYYSITAGTITVTGTTTAGSVHAIYNSHLSSVLKLQGNIVNVGKVMAVFSPVLQISDATTQSWIIRNSSDTDDRAMYTEPDGMPIEADVREGTLYGAADEFEGTLIVPAKSAVLIGIGTDDGVGTLVQSFDYGAIADIVGAVVENNFP
jgi:hypothetical protein